VTDDDRLPFAKFLNGVITEVYQREPFSAEALSVWFTVFTAYDLASVRLGFVKHMTDTETGQFPPKPADILRHLEGSTQARSQQAWAKVHEAIARVGNYRSVVFDDAIIHQVVTDMGGWPHLCQVEVETLPFRAKEFEQRYAGYLLRPRVDYPRVLFGTTDITNGSNGFAETEPVLLGDPEKAKTVYLSGQEGSRLSIAKLKDFLPKLTQS